MKKVRLGLVGCGPRGIGVTMLFKKHPQCEITALMDLFPAAMARAKEKLAQPDLPTFTDFGKMLADAPVDALFFACDPSKQAALACQAMRAGKHVCTEVVAAFTVEDCRNLVTTVEQTGMKYQLMEQTRYWGFIEAWKQMVDRGELGHICLAQGEYVHYERNWGYFTDLETGEVLQDLTPPKGRRTAPTWRYVFMGSPIYYLCHTLSPLLRILDDRVVKVSCMGTRKGSYTYPVENPPFRDIEYAVMHTAKDTILLVGAGFSLPNPKRGLTGHHWYELRGSKGCVESPRGEWDSFRVWKPELKTHDKMDLSTKPLDATDAQAKSGHGGADFKPVDNFIQSILEDQVPLMNVYRMTEMTVPAILAAESAERGGILLDVPQFPEPKKTQARTRKGKT